MADEMTSQLRTATFSDERKGFDKREVREFLSEVADWIEGGGGEVVRRRLERIAHKSAQILADAESGAEGLVREAEQEARTLLDGAREKADSCLSEAQSEARAELQQARAEATDAREGANRYASETRESADEHAEQTTLDAEREAEDLREGSEREARQAMHEAKRHAEQIVAEANGRREHVEAMIADLIVKREAVLAQARKLATDLVKTAERIEEDGAPRRGPVAVPNEAAANPELRSEAEVLRHSSGG